MRSSGQGVLTFSARARAASSSEARAASCKIRFSSACKERPLASARRLSNSKSRSSISRTKTLGIVTSRLTIVPQKMLAQ